MNAPEPVYLKNIPREVVAELDRRWPMVESGHVSAHKRDGRAVKVEHRDVGTLSVKDSR